MLVGLRGASQQASGIKSKTFSFWAGCHYSESAAREEFASLVQERAVVCSLLLYFFWLIFSFSNGINVSCVDGHGPGAMGP